MAFTLINLGTGPETNDGDPLRTGGQKINDSLQYLKDTQDSLLADLRPVLLATYVAAADADFTDLTHFTVTYNNYQFVIENLVPSANGSDFKIQVHSGGAWKTTSYKNAAGVGDGTYISLQGGATPAIANLSGIGISARLFLSAINLTNVNKFLEGRGTYYDGTNMVQSNTLGTWMGGQGAIDGVRFIPTSGNIAMGTIRLYGLKN